MSNFGDDTQYKSSEKLFARADMFKRFGKEGGDWHTWTFDRLLEAGLPVDAQIVDVGGGPGWFWQHNQARIPTGWRVMHTDLSPGMVAEARANIARPGSSFKVVDAEHLPFPDAGLDALIANHMLYHVWDRARALREFVRVLKPGGRLLATTNSDSHMAEAGTLVEAFNRMQRGTLVWPKLDFTLESGKPELAKFFERVELYLCQAGSMSVTEPEALAACITSVGSPDEATQGRLVEYLRGLISAQRMPPINTQSGMFVAWR
jgi:ubiquinone/menaquinone biosynthesis C-methylase UbiE